MLIPINQLNQVIPEERQSLILAHTLANYAMIHLHHATAHDNSVSFAKCSRAARACVSVMKQINDQDYPFLDPVLAVSLTTYLHHELSTEYKYSAMLVKCRGSPGHRAQHSGICLANDEHK